MRLPRSIIRPQNTIPLIAICSGLVLLLGLIVNQMLYRQPHIVIKRINYTQLREANTVTAAASLSIEGETFTVAEQNGSLSQAIVTNSAAQQTVIDEFTKNNVPVEFRSLQPGPVTTALNWLVPLFTLAALGLVGWRVSTSMGGRGGDLQAADTQGSQFVTFADVAGIDEAKAELVETIEFLRDPIKFGRLGGRAPRGILLSGAPGTGKTLLARAAANEAGVPFLAVSGSSFQEKFAGLGAARVRRLFARARKLAPCIIFIDEIDGLGRQRGRGNDSASADGDQTLNQLLVEMDGFNQQSSIVIMASTNRPDILDSALRRPGRFDREVAVSLPDVGGRESILRVHANGLKLEPELDLGWIARGTSGFSGADLANLLNEAAIAATRDDADCINRRHVEYARDKILMGAERHGFMVDEDDRYATAVHEAGHAAVGLHVKNGDPIHKVSILPRGRALGVAQFLPERDRVMKKREYLEDQIAMLLGGRAAEQVLLGTMTAGASNDIERAVEIARRMVTEFGMSSLGPIHLGRPEDVRSQNLLDRVEQAISEIINEQMKLACEVVEASRHEIATLVTALMEQDTLDAQEIHACFA